MLHNTRTLLVALSLSLLAGQVLAQAMSPISFFTGDIQIEPAPETQDWPQIAAGGPGFLAVWDDKRPVLEAGSNTPTGVALQGNGFDIYGALLDSQGQVIKSPIVIANQGRNQTRPQVAWNGQSFLVVWTSERPDWYWFKDIMAIRVSATGEPLDPEPFVIRPNYNVPFRPNDYAENPRVTSDGTNWVVVLEDGVWVESTIIPNTYSLHPNIAAIRIAPDGTLLDPLPVVIYQQDGVAFGPTQPSVAFAEDEYMVVWDDHGTWARRVDLDLQPLDAPFLINEFASGSRIATDGNDFLIVSAQYQGFRVTHDGTVLDGNVVTPPGINFDAGGQGWQPSGPDVAWDGVKYTVAFGSSENTSSDSDLFTARIGTDGTLTGPTLALQTTDFEWKAAVAGAGGGATQIVLTSRFNHIPEDIRAFQLAGDGSIGATTEIGVGMHRQAYLRFASSGDEHMALFVSDGGGQRRLMVQRVNSSGIAIDIEPLVLTTIDGMRDVEADIAFNGTHYLVTWADFFGGIFGQRIAADGTLVDLVPVELIAGAGATGQIAIGALGNTFLIVYTITVSFDFQYFKGVRVRGSDLAVLDPPFDVAFSFANDPRVTGFGDRWLLVWENQTNHDQSYSSVDGRFISAAGVVGANFSIDEAGWSDDPDVFVAGDRALVAWWNTTTPSNTSLEGRVILADGSFITNQFVIADALEDQRQPAVGWDGEQFIVAWMDFRGVDGVEHERADIYAARVAFDGTVVDPDGFALTNTALPEELPDVAGFGGTAMIGFSILHGELEEEVQRIGFRTLTSAMQDADNDTVADTQDNCMLTANTNQRDTDADGIGNLCDTDLNNDCIINFPDLQMLQATFFGADENADFNGDGIVNFLDLEIMNDYFFLTPGPSGIANACDGG